MVKNYSEAEVKVREATSNDPWGPSSTLMSEISDLTYNIVALGEVMRMIWKRLNDHGKNWRHVYKSLVLLDYLIKNGNEKVAQQCKEHIVAIQTLKDFVYMEVNTQPEFRPSLISLINNLFKNRNKRTKVKVFVKKPNSLLIYSVTMNGLNKSVLKHLKHVRDLLRMLWASQVIIK